MPRINGFEICKLLMADEATREIPIIFISSITKAEHIETGLSLGAVDFISKPISKVETLARIKNHLKNNQFKKDLAIANEKLNILLEKNSTKLVEEKSHSKRMNAQLSESEKRFELLFQAAPTAIVMVSVDSGEIVDANNSCCKLAGYEYFELIGLNQNELLQPSEEKISENYFQTKVSPDEKLNVRMSLNTLIQQNGTAIPVQNSSKTVLVDNELYIFSTIFDLRPRLKMENELRLEKNRAEEMSRLKGFFLANISHELRTPLVGILGFSQLLKDELKQEHLIQMAQAITTSGKRLMNTLSVLLEYSTVESGEKEACWSNVNLNNVIQDVIEENRVDFETKNLKVVSNLPAEDLFIDADQSFINEVVSQLLSNAIKYTNLGEITLTLKRKSINDKDFASLTVQDTGIGISDKKFNYIFDDFRQGSEGYTREHDGLGLGLALVKKIVGLHNGNITVQSEVNKGSLFSLTLELKKENLIT
jgi:PAS domain S-box-containing protein